MGNHKVGDVLTKGDISWKIDFFASKCIIGHEVIFDENINDYVDLDTEVCDSYDNVA